MSKIDQSKKPSNVSEEDLAHWEEERQSWNEKQGEAPRSTTLLSSLIPGFAPPEPKDVWAAGCWLSRELRVLGASENEIEEIGFANGQKLLFSQDVWETSNESIADFKRGEWDKPGPVLAERLANKYLPMIIANSKERN